MINFTQSFAKTNGHDVSVVYQSPTTSSRGRGDNTLKHHAYTSNQHLWKAVDIVKQNGFTIDSVVTSGLSTAGNPLVYHIVLSHK